MDRFFRDYNKTEVSQRFVTQSAFSQARLKIKPQAFEELGKDCVDYFYKEAAYKTWNGHRLIGVDGSELLLPTTQETVEKFGLYTTNFMNKSVVLARMSKAFDVLNNLTIDAKLVNREIGEQTLAKQHIKAHLTKGDLWLFDRGYPSYDLFKHILDAEGEFCARLPVNNWSVAKKMIENNQTDICCEIKPGSNIKQKYREQGLSVPDSILCRFICIELSSGEKEVLITSLLDEQQYSHDVFKELYQLRWAIEESYKTDKHRLKLEGFSGTSVTAILQDFYSNIFLSNLTSILCPTELKPNNRKRKWKYKPNFTTALSKVKEVLSLLFTRANLHDLLEALITMIARNTIPIRPNRTLNKNKNKRRRYYQAYKAL